MKEYYQINIERYREYSHKYYFDNIEKRTAYHHQYSIDNKETISRILKIWRKNNTERYKEYSKNYYQEHKETILEKNKKYRQEHKREYNEHISNRRKTDSKHNLSERISSGMRIALKGNKVGRHWENLVGYGLNDLIKRLKKTIPKGYIWEDCMNSKLHVDHIIPISVFNFTKPEHTDFKRCWALENLQLLLAKENRIKHNKLIKPFQPALKI